MQRRKEAFMERLQRVNTKKVGLLTLAGIGGVLLLVQIFYPGNRLLPLASIDGVNVGWNTKQEATVKLNAAYSASKLPIYLGQEPKPFVQPTLKEAAITVDNTARIQSISYPWYLRIIPTSLFWADAKRTNIPAPKFSSATDQYIKKKLMPECTKAPTNATLKPNGSSLTVVSAVPGGQCEEVKVTSTIKAVKPNLKQQPSVRVAMKTLPPAVNDTAARKLADSLNKRLAGGMALSVNNSLITLDAKEVASWLDFPADGSTLTVKANADKAADYLNTNIAPKVAVKPGVSYVTTQDFTEVSRVNGASGQALDLSETLATVEQVLTGEATEAKAVTKAIPPTEQYTRTYSATDAGLSALLANYAKDHKGTFGISLIEMDGKKRRANYNGDKQFVTASTYKLFVAYSLLKRIDAGTKDWNSNATCFNKMISYSDNACAEMFLNDIGLKTITNEINAIGLKNSNFTKSGGPFTTANDLTLLLGMIQSGQNFSPLNRERLISAMKANVYRNGIPAGANGTVADKVGFMDALLHDAAIVYSPSGTYVLAVMTEGSTWGTIADLAKQIDTLRAQ
jgi:beta-lactamase class A